MAASSPAVGAVPFADARGCREWLAAIPLTNIPQAQAHLLAAVKALNEAQFGGLDRLKCLELMREKVAFLLGEQRGRYFGKGLPLAHNDATAWTTGRALLEAMEVGYRRAQERGGAEVAAHRALIAQRILRYLGAQMLFNALAYRRIDPALWRRLHGQYREAEKAGFALERVKDSLEGEDGAASRPVDAYVRAVLLQAAYLPELAAQEVDFAETLVRMWLPKIVVATEPAADSVHALAVDLDGEIGARPLDQVPATPSRRVLDTSSLSKSIRKRIHGLRNEESPASLGLPKSAADVDCLHHLERLHRLWCEGAPPRPPARVPAEKTASLVFGIADIHFFVTGGKVFEQPDVKRELTAREKQDIEVFGRVTERTQTLMMQAHTFTAEPWAVVDEMRGAWRLQRPASATRSVAIGKLVAMRIGDSGPFFLGMVSALVQETDGRIIATVRLFPGKPEALAVRAGDARNRANARWSEGFRLPEMEKLKVPETFVLPTGLAHRGRGVDVWVGEPKEVTVYEVLERGADFDRITVF